MNCWPGSSAFDSSAPIARSFTRSMNELDDAHVHVGFEQRDADLARDLVDVAFGQRPRLRTRGKDSVEAIA